MKLLQKVLLLSLAASLPAMATSNKNNTHVKTNNHQHTNVNSTNMNANHNSSKSSSNSGAFSNSRSSSGSYAGNNGNNHTDQSRSYAVGLPKSDIPRGNTGFNTPIFGASWKSKVETDLYIIDKLGDKTLTKSQRQGYCVRLTSKVRNAMDECKPEIKTVKYITRIRVSEFDEPADNDFESDIGW